MADKETSRMTGDNMAQVSKIDNNNKCAKNDSYNFVGNADSILNNQCEVGNVTRFRKKCP